jgi:DNA-directed RNA polymerase subunit L
MPVWGIDNKIDKYDKKQNNINVEEILEEDGLEDDIDFENSNNLNSSSLGQLTMYVDYKSTSKKIITVTTDHAKFYYDGENIQSPYKIAIPIIKLQPGQNINFSAITNLGIEKIDPIYSAVCVCFYKEINSNEYDFIIESRGQLSEKRIIEVGLINIINMLENIARLIPNNQDGLEGEITIKDENHTLGNLLSHGLQNHKDVVFAGYHMAHLLEEKIIIEYKLKNEKNKIKDIINDVIIYYIELYKEIIKLNKKL